MADAALLRTSHTHLFRGARLTGDPAPGPIAIAFADGMMATAELRAADPLVLDVEAHRTAAGTDIAARSWMVARSPEGLVVRDRVA